MSKQLLAMADAVANEKGVPREDVIEALEAALAATVRRREGDSLARIQVTIDPASGEVTAVRQYEIVTEVEEPSNQMAAHDPDAVGLSLGQTYDVPLAPPALTRVAAQTAKQVVIQRLRDSLRGHVVEQWQDRV